MLPERNYELRTVAAAGALAQGGDGARVAIKDRELADWPSDMRAVPTDELAELNVFEPDASIRFDEGPHKYYIRGLQAEMSVTTFVHAFFAGFDAEAVLRRMSATRKATEHPGLSDREIARKWRRKGDLAAGLGTRMHAAIEVFCNTGLVSRDPLIAPEMEMWRRFYQAEIVARGLEFYRTEPIIFADPETNNGWGLPGSVDCLCRDPATGRVWIFDWKRVPATKFGDKAYRRGTRPPFDQLKDNKRTLYSLQLHTYRYILQRWYGLEIAPTDLYMVSFHPENAGYAMIQALDVAAQVEWMFQHYDLVKAAVHEHLALDARSSAWINAE
jgi:hypothetical protein